MKIAYLSGSKIPSRMANSIHVVKMCQAFAKNGHDVILMVPRRKGVESDVHDVFSFYGVESCFKIVHLAWLPVKAKGYVYGYLAAKKAKTWQADLVYGRNLIGCSLAGLMGMPVIFESHAPVNNGNRLSRWMFRKLVHAAGFHKLVVITHSLKKYYLACHPSLADKVQVVPDGADPVSDDVEPATLPRQDNRLCVGYVGQLYPGKGMEVVERLARACPWADFHVVGGTDRDVDAWKARIASLSNVFLHGFKSPVEAERYRLAADVLLAPYQGNLSAQDCENGGLDIAKWMSPLKIFEYMAAGKAIVCSDLPVLREILTHNANALLVSPGDIPAWERSLVSLRDDRELRLRLGGAARADFLAHYTWAQRAASVLCDVSSPLPGSRIERK